MWRLLGNAAAFLLALVAPSGISAQPHAGLEGIWMARRIVGPARPIPVRLERQGAHWRIRLGSAEARGESQRYERGLVRQFVRAVPPPEPIFAG